MNCSICLENDKTKFKVLDCCHKLCTDCYDKLVKNTCPFCRTIISGKEEKDYGIKSSYDIEAANNNLDILANENINNSFITNTNVYTNNKSKSHKKKYKKKRNNKGFVPNSERIYMRRKKKFKKQRNVEYVY